MLTWCQPTSKKPTTWVGFEYHYYDSNSDIKVIFAPKLYTFMENVNQSCMSSFNSLKSIAVVFNASGILVFFLVLLR